MSKRTENAIERYEACIDIPFDMLINDFENNKHKLVVPGRYAHLVKIKKGDTPRKEIFNGYPKKDKD